MRARDMFAVASLTISTVTAGGMAQAQDCQPGLAAEASQASAAYTQLVNAIVPQLNAFTADMQGLTQATYPTVLARAQTLAGFATGGRVVLTVPDGTVVIDTGRPAGTNTWANFQAKTVNENHNSRLAILAAQEYPCAVGIERKFSTSTNSFETALAVRLGDHLSSFGTIRISRP